MLELIGRYLSQAFEARDLGRLAQGRDGHLFFNFGIAIYGFFFIPHPEQGRLKDIQMSCPHQVGKKLQKEGEQQQAYVHAVDISVGIPFLISFYQILLLLLII